MKFIFTFGQNKYMVERLSTVQYGLKSGMSKQLILYYIGQGKTLPGVIRVEWIAGRHILHTDLPKLQQYCKNKLKKIG